MNSRGFSPTTFLGALCLLSATEADAQSSSASRVDSFVPARLETLKRCPSLPSPTLGENPQEVQAFGGLFAPIIAGFVGDLATAGLNSIAGALEEASKARGTGVEGVTVFEFYTVARDGNTVSIAPLGDIGCLKLSTPKDSRPTVTAEIEVRRFQDGFALRPVKVEYTKPLPKAPNKPAKAELHVEFSVAVVGQDGAAPSKVFALARIMLPSMAAGSSWDAESLGSMSEVLPFRPESAMLTQVRAQLQPFEQIQEKRIDEQVGAVQRAMLLGAKVNDVDDFEFPESPDCPNCDDDKLEAAAIKGLSDEKKTELDAVDKRLLAARAALGEARARTQPAFFTSLPSAVGTTTAKVRFLIIKDESSFGMGIAAALKGRAPAAGTALTQTIGPPAKASWTAEKSTHVLAVARRDRASVALALARLGGDTAGVDVAATEYLEARLAVNLAAAALGLPAPHPDPKITD